MKKIMMKVDFFFWINVFLIIRFGRRLVACNYKSNGVWDRCVHGRYWSRNPWFRIPPLLVLEELKNPWLCLRNVGGGVGWKRRKWAGEWRWRDIRLRWTKTKRSLFVKRTMVHYHCSWLLVPSQILHLRLLANVQNKKEQITKGEIEQPLENAVITRWKKLHVKLLKPKKKRRTQARMRWVLREAEVGGGGSDFFFFLKHFTYSIL